MIKRVKEFLKLNNINITSNVIVAVSGGVDSVVLAYILHELGYKCVMAHVNHHKREQSEIEAVEMEKYAKSLDMPFELLNYYYDGEDNFHNDSHNARYHFFESLCEKYNTNVIMTAHHLDDQIETIIMKLLEGSNLYGYGGISICKDDGKFITIRPLLCASKEEIYKFAKDNNLKYFEDSSNGENLFLRNRIRHNIVPILKEECEDLYIKTSEYSVMLKEAFAYIRKASIKYLNDNGNMIKLETFNNLDIALKKDIICLMLEKYEIRKNNNIILNILDILSDNKGNKKINLNSNYSFIRNYGSAYIDLEKVNLDGELKLDIDDVIHYGGYKFYFSKNSPISSAKYIKLCYNNLKFPFFIRNKKDGDFIKLKSGNKKVSRVFIDNKVEKEKRDFVPIICDGDGNVIWVYDFIKSDLIYDMKNKADICLIVEVENEK